MATVCRELCKNGWTDRDIAWDLDSDGPKEALSGRGAHWRYLSDTLNRLCAATMRPVVKLLRPLLTFRVTHSWGEMYIGHGRLCVCLSLTEFPHYCTDPDLIWGIVGVPSSCACGYLDPPYAVTSPYSTRLLLLSESAVDFVTCCMRVCSENRLCLG